jgi:hypothetical protein
MVPWRLRPDPRMLAVADAPVVGRPYYQEGDKVSWETAWAEAEVARRFVHRLSELSRAERRPALLRARRDHTSAWLNIEAASAGAGSRSGTTSASVGELDANGPGLAPELRRHGEQPERCWRAAGNRNLTPS